MVPFSIIMVVYFSIIIYSGQKGVEVPDPSVPFDVNKMILNRWSEFHRKAEGGYNAVES